MNIKENIKTGKYSNIAGAIIIVAAIASVFIEPLKIGWSETVIPIGIGLALMGFVKK